MNYITYGLQKIKTPSFLMGMGMILLSALILLGFAVSANAQSSTVCEPGDEGYSPRSDLSATLRSDKSMVTIENQSSVCAYEVGLASYRGFGPGDTDNGEPPLRLDDQELFDSASAVVATSSTVELAVNLPGCAYQVDAFYGEAIENISLDNDYDERLLDYGFGGLDENDSIPFCEDGTNPGNEVGTSTVVITKEVVNDDSGSATSSDFDITLENASSGVTSTFVGSIDGQEYDLVIAGSSSTFMITEGGPEGYEAVFSGDCSADGSISVTPNQSANCTITNDDVNEGASQSVDITVGKIVVDDSATTTATSSDFSFQIIDAAGSPVSLTIDGESTMEIPGSRSGITASFLTDAMATTSVRIKESLQATSSSSTQSFTTSFAGDCNTDGVVLIDPQAKMSYSCEVTNTVANSDEENPPAANPPSSGGSGGGSLPPRDNGNSDENEEDESEDSNNSNDSDNSDDENESDNGDVAGAQDDNEDLGGLLDQARDRLRDLADRVGRDDGTVAGAQDDPGLPNTGDGSTRSGGGWPTFLVALAGIMIISSVAYEVREKIMAK